MRRHRQPLLRVFLWTAVLVCGWCLGHHPPTARSQSAGVGEQQRTFVRRVYDAREAYQASLERLQAYYTHVHDDEQLYWAEQELRQFHMVTKAPYILELDLPPRDLRPTQNLPKANAVFRDAIGWLEKRSYSEGEENTKRAELLLRRLIRDYPSSDKIDEACYYLGNIYASKYYQQYPRAVAFYERVLDYEPSTNLDARMSAATIYETKLADRNSAKRMYQQVLQHEIDPDKTREARRRLDALLGSRAPRR